MFTLSENCLFPEEKKAFWKNNYNSGNKKKNRKRKIMGCRMKGARSEKN